MPMTAVGRQRLTGAVVLSVLLVLSVLAWQRPDPFAEHVTVRAVFDDSSGLAPIGDEVRMAGTRVGRVAERRRLGDHALLTLELDPGVGTIHRDASAELRPRLMFEGTAFVDLHPGSRSHPPLGDRAIPLARTRNYVPLGDALGVLNAHARANVGTVASGLAVTVRPANDASIRQVLRTAPRLTRTLALTARAARGTHAVELRRSVLGLARTARAIGSRAADLEPLERSSTATAAALAIDSGRPLDAALARLPGTLANVRGAARSARPVLDRLTPLARELRPGVVELGPTLTAVRPLLRRATPVVDRLPPFVRNLRVTLDAAPAAAPRALEVLHALRPTLAMLNRTLLTALERRTNLGTPAYLAFLNLFEGGGGASRPFGVQGDGHLMRFGLRFLTGAGQPLPPCTLLAQAFPELASGLSSAGGCTP